MKKRILTSFLKIPHIISANNSFKSNNFASSCESHQIQKIFSFPGEPKRNDAVFMPRRPLPSTSETGTIHVRKKHAKLKGRTSDDRENWAITHLILAVWNERRCSASVRLRLGRIDGGTSQYILA